MSLRYAWAALGGAVVGAALVRYMQSSTATPSIPDPSKKELFRTHAAGMEAEGASTALQKLFEHVDNKHRGTVSGADIKDFFASIGLVEQAEALSSSMGIESQEVNFPEFARRINAAFADSRTLSKHPQVFLGGSCGTTTWRKEIACPRLAEASITFYDPQVAAWNPHLIALENFMKACCRTLLFVIDSSTRSIISMIEAAQYIAAGRTVILVVHTLPDNAMIRNEQLSADEVSDLNRARRYLVAIAEMYEVPVYASVEAACNAIVQDSKLPL